MNDKEEKTKLRFEFSGQVQFGDSSRLSDELNGALWIGGMDVIDELTEQFKDNDQVRVTINGEVVAEGRIFIDLGWGYSEYTPMDSDDFAIYGGWGKKRFDVADYIKTLVENDPQRNVLLIVENV